MICAPQMATLTVLSTGDSIVHTSEDLFLKENNNGNRRVAGLESGSEWMCT